MTDNLPADLLGSVPETATKKRSENEIPSYPYQCGVDGCLKDTVVATVIVRSMVTGDTRTGTLSEVGFIKRGKSPVDAEKLILRDGYAFCRWVTRCAYHCAHDVAKAGRSANPKLNREKFMPPPQDEQERREYLEVMRNLVGQIAKPMPGATK